MRSANSMATAFDVMAVPRSRVDRELGKTSSAITTIMIHWWDAQV
jgi:hypothetical protein